MTFQEDRTDLTKVLSVLFCILNGSDFLLSVMIYGSGLH